MNDSSNLSSRREFIKTTGRVAAASALAGVAIPYVHAAGSETIQLALIGCGSRGSGAAGQAMAVKKGGVKLVAMADVFGKRLDDSYTVLNSKFADTVDVPPERKFVGFDAYQHAMDCLKPGDIAIFATPLAFRWVHFDYAIKKGLNVFMEKPLTADGPTSRRMLKLAGDASAKNLKVAVGLMSRHARALQQLHQRIQDGELGDIILMRGYRMAEMLAAAFATKWPGNPSELLWQIANFHCFMWAGGGCYSDFYIHHIDQLCWMKNALPVKAQAIGGRHYKYSPSGELYVDQNFDSYSVEYTFADGTKMYIDGRCTKGCEAIYSSYAHGTKGMAIVAHHSDCGGPSSIFSSQNPDRQKLVWASNVSKAEQDAHFVEWIDFMEAIRNDKPYNEVTYGVQASLVTSMGRMAAHTGQQVTYEDMLNHPDEYAPGVDKLTMDSAPPVRSKPDGTYPIPMPGIVIDHEYPMA
jgi:predicted dehydrogenase